MSGNNHPKTIGLTGGIGSGKTTVAGFFRDFGVPVYIADEEAKKIMETSTYARKEIIALLGEKAYNKDKLPDRTYIASKVFGDKKLLESLNKIIHPKVRAHFEAWKKKQKSVYVLYEAAILFESGGDETCDYVILVTAPEETRIKRVVERDQTSPEKVKARMDNQWAEEKKRKLADFIIENIRISETKTQSVRLHKKLLKLLS